mmetsp:Transcript_14710/g.39393  ORF Transcript_14710/g.39393 Transcript_14710/m.39393 type:complete len:221 (-) Transcript_14710:665-1327(-)
MRAARCRSRHRRASCCCAASDATAPSCYRGPSRGCAAGSPECHRGCAGQGRPRHRVRRTTLSCEYSTAERPFRGTFAPAVLQSSSAPRKAVAAACCSFAANQAHAAASSASRCTAWPNSRCRHLRPSSSRAVHARSGASASTIRTPSPSRRCPPQAVLPSCSPPCRVPVAGRRHATSETDRRRPACSSMCAEEGAALRAIRSRKQASCRCAQPARRPKLQ